MEHVARSIKHKTQNAKHGAECSMLHAPCSIMSVNRRERGFTLIELLIVIAIVSILAGIILAYITNQSNKANDKKTMQQVSSMRSQASLYDGVGRPVPPTLGPVSPYDPTSLTHLASSYGLFDDPDITSNSLYALIHGLPGTTSYYYAWDGNPPSGLGKWFFMATLSSGTVCSDWSGQIKVGTVTIANPLRVSDWSPYVDEPAYLCL